MLLSDYEYVHQCLKLGTDVHVTMVMLADAIQTFSYEVRNPLKSQYTYYIAILCMLCLCISLLPSKKMIVLVVSRIILCLFLSKHCI